MTLQFAEHPKTIVWQLTFACQLRCTHCYTESGRRASQKLSRDELMRVADVILTVKPDFVLVAGGEPLLVPELFEILATLKTSIGRVWVYTNGLGITERMAHDFAGLGVQVNVSLDGATSGVHDAIRGRIGAFDETMEGLRTLDRVATSRRQAGRTKLRFGIDVVVVRSNFAQIEQFFTTIAPTLPQLAMVQIGAVIPSGLAARKEFARHELLTAEQLAKLADPVFERHLRAVGPPGLDVVTVVNNVFLQLHSRQARLPPSARQIDTLEIEPSGGVRAIETYEGVVGNILHEKPAELWKRCEQRANDPMYVAELADISTSEEWAAAVRKLDDHFATPEDLHRIRRRPEYTP